MECLSGPAPDPGAVGHQMVSDELFQAAWHATMQEAQQQGAPQLFQHPAWAELQEVPAPASASQEEQAIQQLRARLYSTLDALAPPTGRLDLVSSAALDQGQPRAPGLGHADPEWGGPSQLPQPLKKKPGMHLLLACMSRVPRCPR